MKSYLVDHVFSLLSLVLEAPDYTKEFLKSPISSRVLVLLETWRRNHRVGARCFTNPLHCDLTDGIDLFNIVFVGLRLHISS